MFQSAVSFFGFIKAALRTYYLKHFCHGRCCRYLHPLQVMQQWYSFPRLATSTRHEIKHQKLLLRSLSVSTVPRHNLCWFDYHHVSWKAYTKLNLRIVECIFQQHTFHMFFLQTNYQCRPAALLCRFEIHLKVI